MHSVKLCVLSAAFLISLPDCTDRPLPGKMTDSDVGTSTSGATDHMPSNTTVPTTGLIPNHTSIMPIPDTSSGGMSESSSGTTTGLTLCELYCEHCPILAHREPCSVEGCESWLEFCPLEGSAFVNCSIQSDNCGGMHSPPECIELWQFEDGLFYCIVSYCGDGVLQGGIGEECDDGNTISGDGCNLFCQTEAPCEGCGEGEK